MHIATVWSSVTVHSLEKKTRNPEKEKKPKKFNMKEFFKFLEEYCKYFEDPRTARW